MSDNLIFYINKLSYYIVAQDFEIDKSQHEKKTDGRVNRDFDKCVRKIRQKGCDVLLNQSRGTFIEDPCVTDYGGNWSPFTLISDYGKELETERDGKYSDLLMTCIKTLSEKKYNCVDDMLKFLLLLKKPLQNEPSGFFQSDLSLKSSDFFLSGLESLFLNEDFSKDCLKTSTSRKAPKYVESWTKQFDSSFKLLGELSKKNLTVFEKSSAKSLLTSKALVLFGQSQTNVFGITDFFYQENFKSEKSLFNIQSCDFQNENSLLDSLVERPISHKLPLIKLKSDFSSKNWFLEKSATDISRYSKNEDKPPTAASFDGVCQRKNSLIELKRNDNYSHSFSILCDKSSKSPFWTLGSIESVSSKDKGEEKASSSFSSSKEIILGLWEQEQSLIREFRPELASTFPSLRMISLDQYVEDVKYLFTGISSETFVFDSERVGFSMVYGTCLEDVTPESLFHFSRDFIEMGDCYVKIIGRVYGLGKNNFDACTTISQAFGKSIFDYLELHYSLVLDIPASVNLIALKSCTRDLHDIIKTVGWICKINSKEPLPEGGELLTYLLKIAERTNRQSAVNIVFGILQNCCNVYYTCILQRWMFNGVLDCQNNELFVDFQRQKNKAKSRTYYNSFFLVGEKIPSFLRGYEESFYNCGKSIHFLKLFNSEDKFCQLLDKGCYPSMQLCFTDDKLHSLEEKFKSYEEQVRSECGDRITIKMIKEEEAEKERKYLEYVKECKSQQEKLREEERSKRVEQAKEAKEEKNKLLNEQLAAIEEKKERERQREEEEKLKTEEEIHKWNETRKNLMNMEMRDLKESYEVMMEKVEMEMRVSKMRAEDFRKILDKTRGPDTINGNEVQTDHEGNIRVLPKPDINSNESWPETEKEVEKVEKAKEKKEEISFSEEDNGCAAIVYDENSNPRIEVEDALEKEGEPTIRSCVSFRTAAAEEAEKNKFKVLRSEFELSSRIEEKLPIQRKNSFVKESKKCGKKTLQLDTNILLKDNGSFASLRSVPEYLVPEKKQEETKPSSEDIGSTLFKTVALERKTELTDLKRSELRSQPIHSFSSESGISVEELTNNSEDHLQSPQSSSMILNEKYNDALSRDTELFHKKNSRLDMFCSLKEEEDLDNLPCTDYLRFERYLRKSALIPLRVQERLANDALLKHLLKGENLLSHLHSLRSYFFLSDGEFGRSFTQQVFRSLSRCSDPRQFFERSNLSNIVNEALNYTIHSSELNSQNLSFRILNMPPFLNHSSHDVLFPFELTYKVDWPLNFILTEKALAKYKMVFRFLLKLKRINWTLNENFLHLNFHFKKRRLREKVVLDSVHYHKIQIFRHAMTQVMITLDDYIFYNGVQLPWIYFLKDLETTENIDHLYQKHVRYIKDVLTRCFLSKNSEDLLECIHNLIELALKFHYTTKSSAMEVVEGRLEHPKFSVLKTTFGEFCSVIKTFLKTLKEKISSNEVVRSHQVLLEKFDLKLT